MRQNYIIKLLFVLTLLTVATWAVPAPHNTGGGGEDKDKKPPCDEIHVTSPGPGPWAIGSLQAVTWWSNSDNIENPYSEGTTVSYKVFAHTPSGDEEVTGDGPFRFGYGYAPLPIGCIYQPGVKYYVKVTLDKPGKDGKPVCGTSGFFTVYRTEDKSVCPEKGGPPPPKPPTPEPQPKPPTPEPQPKPPTEPPTPPTPEPQPEPQPEPEPKPPTEGGGYGSSSDEEYGGTKDYGTGDGTGGGTGGGYGKSG